MAFYDLRDAGAAREQRLTVTALRAAIEKLPPDAVVMIVGDGALVAAQTEARAAPPSVWLLASSGRDWTG